jgi:hypothetical protein
MQQEGSKPVTYVLFTYRFVTVPNLDFPQSRETMDRTFSHKITMPTTTKREAVDKESKSEGKSEDQSCGFPRRS